MANQCITNMDDEMNKTLRKRLSNKGKNRFQFLTNDVCKSTIIYLIHIQLNDSYDLSLNILNAYLLI